VYYKSHPFHPPSFYHPNNIWRSLQVMKLLIMQSSPVSCYFLPLRSKYAPQHPVLIHPLQVWQTKFHTHIKQQVKL
jgi:hypothetical protein